jgi:type I restriction enzyme, S subunit
MNTVVLSKIAVVSSGQGAPQGDKSYGNEGTPFIKAGNLEDLLITKDEFKSCKQINAKVASRYKLKQYPVDTIVFAKSGMSAMKGRVYCLNNPSYVVNHLATITPNKEQVKPRYLKYYFQHFPPTRLIKDRAYPSIRLEDINNIELALPNIGEQEEIVSILDQADSLRQKRKQAIDLLDEYLKSVFLEMFGDPVTNPKDWEYILSDDYCDLLTVGVVIKPASYYQSSGVIALRSLNIKPNAINLNNVVYFSKEDNNGKLSKSKLKKDDVVIVRTGLTGTAAVIPEELDGANCIDLIIARPKQELINSIYFSFLINSDRGKHLISLREVGGIQKHFNVSALKQLQIPAPPIELQSKFAQIVKDTEALKQKMYVQAEELDNQFNALMQKNFNSN